MRVVYHQFGFLLFVSWIMSPSRLLAGDAYIALFISIVFDYPNIFVDYEIYDRHTYIHCSLPKESTHTFRVPNSDLLFSPRIKHNIAYSSSLLLDNSVVQTPC